MVLNDKHINKYGYSGRIKGSLALSDEEVQIYIKTNSQKLIEEDVGGKRLYALEQFFYQIVKNHFD